MTALGNPALLQRASTALTTLHGLFRKFDEDGAWGTCVNSCPSGVSSLGLSRAHPPTAALRHLPDSGTERLEMDAVWRFVLQGWLKPAAGVAEAWQAG